MKLGIGELQRIRVDARKKHSGDRILDVAHGERYDFLVEGEQTWVDLIKRTDADGFNYPIGKRHLRIKGTFFFCLCGVVVKDLLEKELFAIGKSNAKTISEDGQLYFFANDVPGFYWNNSEYIVVTVTRLH